MTRVHLASAAIFLIAAAVTSIFFIQFCATVFQCGCQALWGNADRFCNIHAAHGRHCPWCSFGNTGYALVYGSMIAVQAALAFLPARWGWGWALRLASSLAAFPAVGTVLAISLGLYTGYWNH